MRPVARQSHRLANCSRKRHSSLQRHAESQHRRSFHTSVQRSQEPRPPNSQSDDHASYNEWREAHKKTESGTARHEPAGDPDNGEAKTSNGNQNSSIRRTLRQKRFNDVPKPPPIPEWFLEHNVKLLRDSPGLGVSKENGQVIRCIDSDTGHTLFTVPYYEAWPSVSAPEKASKAVEKTTPVPTQQSSPNEEDVVHSLSGNHAAEEKQKHALEQNFFDHKFQPSKGRPRKAQQDPKRSSRGSLTGFALPKNASDLEAGSNPMKWVFLEAETTARAALSLSSDNQRSSSFSSDRVDLSLQCPDAYSHEQMDGFVRDLARITQADLIRFDVTDLADLTADFVGHGRDDPGSYAHLGYDVFDGHTAKSVNSQPHRFSFRAEPDEETQEFDEDEEDGEEHEDVNQGSGTPFTSLKDLKEMIQSGRLGQGIQARVVGIGLDLPQGLGRGGGGGGGGGLRLRRPSSTSDHPEMNRDEARLDKLLNQLLDAPIQKKSSQVSESPLGVKHSTVHSTDRKKTWASENVSDDQSKSYQRILRYWRSNPAYWLPQTAKSLVGYLGRTLESSTKSIPAYTLSAEPRDVADEASFVPDRKRTIIHVRELRDICNTRLGDTIIQRLVKIVRKRRRSGEQIMIVGTTAQDVPGPFRLPGDSGDDFPFRAITVPPFFDFSLTDDGKFESTSQTMPQKGLDDPADRRILDVNLRHLQSMLRRLRPEDMLNLLSTDARIQLNMPGMHFLTERALSVDEVQRLALIAIGLSESHAKSDRLEHIHVALAGFISTRSDHAVQSWSIFKAGKQERKGRTESGSSFTEDGAKTEDTDAKLERLKKSCNTHESRLLSGVVNPQNIKTGFNDVHATPDTIDALKTMTSLSLLRPDAFKYGVLANDRLSGLLLYGPPGTGKTLLAKAVARESRATVLEVTGAQIYEKYVGEGEKMVRAIFSLAKKLSPVVVFLDEADAIFGSRSNAGNRNTHREIINQFLREWDGMSEHGVFIMVATNRPFDLDDAVIRRLPRRLLVDLPVAKDRESILGIHLRNESLDSTVSLSKLAEQTPLYSGSDLKNLAVAAALAAVREENESVEANKNDKDFKLPEKRTLTAKHFDKALAEISASINEDMSSLSAIRKFDEQYGDRKGRRKKSNYGFGLTDGAADETAAMVRQPSASTPPP